MGITAVATIRARIWDGFLRYPPIGFALLLAADLLWHFLAVSRAHTPVCVIPFLLGSAVLTIACTWHAPTTFDRVAIFLLCVVSFFIVIGLAIVASQLVTGPGHIFQE